MTESIRHVVVGGGTPTVDFDHGTGIWLFDRAGRSYIDCTSQSWALYLGHANPELRQHAFDVMANGWHVHQGFATSARELFAGALLDRVQGNAGWSLYDRVAYTATSALAIETAIKLAVLDRPGRSVIGRVRGGFHGTTLGTAPLSWPGRDDVPEEQRSLSAFANFGPAVVTFEFPDVAGGIDAAISTLKAELAEHASGLAAVVVEPIQGSGGQRALPDWWLKALIEASDEHGYAVIFDEIQTYLRAGRYFTVNPDLPAHFVALGKGLAGGFGAGAVIMRRDARGFPPGTYDLHTFASSALSHSVGLKLLEIVDRDLLLANARRRGEQLAVGLRDLATRFPGLGAVRQVGLHVGLSVGEQNAPSPELARSIRLEAVDRGLLLGLGGYDPSVLKFKPPLNVTEGEVSEILGRFADAVMGGGR